MSGDSFVMKRGTDGYIRIQMSGFQKTNPFYTYNIKYKTKKSYDTKTRHYFQLVFDKGPYDFFITLTVGKRMSISTLCGYINKLIVRYNERLFTRKWYKKRRYIEGFAFLEKHLSNISRNEEHVHMLVKCHDRFDEITFRGHEAIFRKAACRVVDDRQGRVFKDKGIDFQPFRDEGAVEYCFKRINDKRLDRIKVIGANSLSDNLGED